jgi:hypothetical protein
MIVAFDPSCATTQQEDRVSLWTDAKCSSRIGDDFFGQPYSMDEAALVEGVADKKKRAAVLQRRWPKQVLVIPGRTLTVVFEAASDYVNNANSSKFGLRLSVTSHGLTLPAAAPLLHLERELAHAASLSLAYSLSFGAMAAMTPSAATARVVKRKKGKAPDAPGGMVVVPDWSWENTAGSSCEIDGGTVAAASMMGNSCAVLSHGISSGHLYWDMTVDQETTSQCTCLGIATGKVSTTSYS